MLQATNTSQNVGYHGPVCIYNTGLTGIAVCKRLWMDADGLSAHAAVANAETHTTIQNIVAKRQLIERMAWKRAGKQQAEAEQIASQHASWMAGQRVDQQAAECWPRPTRTTARSSAVPWPSATCSPRCCTSAPRPMPWRW